MSGTRRPRKPRSTHSFLGILACDWCGHKVRYDAAGVAEMQAHLNDEHQVQESGVIHEPEVSR